MSAVPARPTTPIAKAIGMRMKVSASISANAIRAWVIAGCGASDELVLARRVGREDVYEVHDARDHEEDDDRVDVGRVADLQHRGGVAVGGDLLRLVPHQVREAEEQRA